MNRGRAILPGAGAPPASTVTVWPRSRSSSVNRRVETTAPLPGSSQTSITIATRNGLGAVIGMRKGYRGPWRTAGPRSSGGLRLQFHMTSWA